MRRSERDRGAGVADRRLTIALSSIYIMYMCSNIAYKYIKYYMQLVFACLPCIILILLQRERLALILSGREIKTVVPWTGENVIYGMPLAFIKQFQQYIDDLCSRLDFRWRISILLCHIESHSVYLLICAVFDAVEMCIVLIGAVCAIQMCQK